MSSHKNRVKMTSATTGTGTLTLGSASSGHQSFATAYGADATVDILITEGTAWEVARDCAYTNSGTTVSRGTLEASSTGSAINFGGTQEVSVIATADRGRTWDSAALNTHTSASPTTADVTGVVGTLHLLDISGLTASRNFILPAAAAVGDRVGVFITTGDDTYGLILKADTGDSIIADNDTFTATEWTRLLTKGEAAFFRCTVANSTWVVESRKLNGLICTMLKNTTTSVANTTTTKIAVNETSLDTAGGQADPTTNNRINIRRAGRYRIVGNLTADGSAITGAQVRINKNGALLFNQGSSLAAGGAAIPADAFFPLAVGDYLELYAYHASGASRTFYGGAGALSCSIATVEIL